MLATLGVSLRLSLLVLGVAAFAEQTPSGTGTVPLVQGLTLVWVLQFPQGDRENVVVVEDVSAAGVTYAWRLRQRTSAGETSEDFARFVRASDLQAAPRLNTVFQSPGRSETPGYTAFSLSRDTYGRLRVSHEAPFTVTSMQGGPFGGAAGGLFASRVALKGTLTLVSPTPELMPLLLDGHRVMVETLRLKGHFALQATTQDSEFWVLADSTHPLLLKVVTGQDVLQIVRVDRPDARVVERELEQRCRAELPGIYFAFGSAELEAASEPALKRVAETLVRHRDWTVSVEGHTDSVGEPSANQTLSERRATATRSALVEHGVQAGRLRAAGFGATRPRERNTTVEGRARNRRVELVRSCNQSGQ